MACSQGHEVLLRKTSPRSSSYSQDPGSLRPPERSSRRTFGEINPFALKSGQFIRVPSRLDSVVISTKSDSDRRIHARDSVAGLPPSRPRKEWVATRTLPTSRDGLLPVHVTR